jgi:hypothetical protein
MINNTEDGATRIKCSICLVQKAAYVAASLHLEHELALSSQTAINICYSSTKQQAAEPSHHCKVCRSILGGSMAARTAALTNMSRQTSSQGSAAAAQTSCLFSLLTCAIKAKLHTAFSAAAGVAPCHHLSPMQKQSTFRIGPAIMEARTRGVTK